MNKEKLQQLAHLVAGIILLLQGFNWFEEGISLSVSMYLLVAAMVLLIAGMHKWVQRKFSSGEAAFFLCEAAAFGYAAVNNHEDGYQALWIIFLILAIIYTAIAVATFSVWQRQGHGHHRKSRRRRRRIKTGR